MNKVAPNPASIPFENSPVIRILSITEPAVRPKMLSEVMTRIRFVFKFTFRTRKALSRVKRGARKELIGATGYGVFHPVS